MSKRGLLVLTGLLVVSIARCESVSKGGAGTAAGGAAAAAVQVPPVVYDANAASQPLSAEQREEILTVARAHCPEGRSIWFLYVHRNRQYDGKLHHRTSVYYSPDNQTPRLRTGSYMLTGEYSPGSEIRPTIGRYCQVSRPSEPFSAEFDLPEGVGLRDTFGQERRAPDWFLLPFPAPEGCSDDEIVEVVDLVRSLKQRAEARSSEQTERPSQRQSQDEITSEFKWLPELLRSLSSGDPIGQISRDGEVVTVVVGSWERDPDAVLTVVSFVKTEKGYKVTDFYSLWP